MRSPKRRKICRIIAVSVALGLVLEADVSPAAHSASHTEGVISYGPLIEFFYLRPVLQSLRFNFRQDQELLGLLDRVQRDLAVPEELSLFPNAWAESVSSSSAPILVDMTYLYSRVEAHWLATLFQLRSDQGYRLDQDAQANYRAACFRARAAGDPRPWFQLDYDLSLPFGSRERLSKHLSKPLTAAVEEERMHLGRHFLAWILLHEIAHHRLGHTATARPLDDVARSRELDADWWAFGMMNRIGYSLTTLGLLLFVEADIESVALSAGYSPPRRHPTWATRLQLLRQFRRDRPPPRCDQIALRTVLAGSNTIGRMAYEVFTVTFPTDPANAGNAECRVVGIELDGSVPVGIGLNRGVCEWHPDGSAVVRFRIGDDLIQIRFGSPLGHESRCIISVQRIGSASATERMCSAERFQAPEPVTGLLFGNSALQDLPNARLRRGLRMANLTPAQVDRVRVAFSAWLRTRERLIRQHAAGVINDDMLYAAWRHSGGEYWSRLENDLPPYSYDAFRKAFMKTDYKVQCFSDDGNP